MKRQINQFNQFHQNWQLPLTSNYWKQTRPRRILIEIQAWDRNTKRVWNEPISDSFVQNYQYSANLVKIRLGGVIGSLESSIDGDRDRRGRDRMVVGFTTTCAISAGFVYSNPTHNEVYSIQHYVITFVSDLWQVGGFLQVLRFPPPIKLTATI